MVGMHAWLSCVYPMALHPDLLLLRLEHCSATGGLHIFAQILKTACIYHVCSCSVAAVLMILLRKRSAEG